MDLMTTYKMLQDEERQAQSEQRYQMAQQQDQDLKIASGINNKLQEFRDDPARYSAFKAQFIDGNPQVKSAMERVYTPQGLAAILDVSQMETPEQQVQKKGKLNAQYQGIMQEEQMKRESSPEFIKIKTAQALEEQKLKNRLMTDPDTLAAQNQIAKSQALGAQATELDPTYQANLVTLGKSRAEAQVKAQNAGEKTNAYQEIEARKKAERNPDVVATFKANYGAINDMLLKGMGLDKNKGVPFTAWTEGNNTPQARKGVEGSIPENMIAYQKAKLQPDGWTVDIKEPNGKISKATEDDIKNSEYEAQKALINGFFIEDGKKVDLTTEIRNKLIDGLLMSPVTGSTSPFAFSVIHMMNKLPTDNMTVEEKKKYDEATRKAKKWADMHARSKEWNFRVKG